MVTKLEEFIWKHIGATGIGIFYHYPDFNKIGPSEVIAEYCKKKEFKNIGMFMAGPVGAGKTSILSFIAYCIACDMGHGCLRDYPDDSEYWTTEIENKLMFISANRLFSLFFDNDDNRRNLRILENIDYLMVDDLGREYRTDYTLTRLEEFIEIRYSRKLVTFITTNIVPGDLVDLYNERIISRFKDSKWMRRLTMAGEDMRS